MACPYISVLTVSTGRRGLLVEKAEALRAQTLPPDRFEWVVCLNGGDDGSADALDALRLPFTLRLFETRERLPAGKARNLCAQRTCGSILLVSDDGCVPRSESLAAHVAVQEAGLCVAVGRAHAGMGAARWRGWQRFNRLASRPGAWSVPGTVFRALGGFDEACRDVRRAERDLERRLVRAGVAFRSLKACTRCGEAAGDGSSEGTDRMEDVT